MNNQPKLTAGQLLVGVFEQLKIAGGTRIINFEKPFLNRDAHCDSAILINQWDGNFNGNSIIGPTHKAMVVLLSVPVQNSVRVFDGAIDFINVELRRNAKLPEIIREIIAAAITTEKTDSVYFRLAADTEGTIFASGNGYKGMAETLMKLENRIIASPKRTYTPIPGLIAILSAHSYKKDSAVTLAEKILDNVSHINGSLN